MEGLTPELLNEQFAIGGQVEFCSGAGGLLMAEIENEHAAAQIALQGAQVLAYRPHGSAPVLFESARAIYAPGKAVRGGIPICWPWFGPHPSDHAKPQHGFARTASWEVLGSSALQDGATEVRLGLSDTPATLSLWPHSFALTLTVRIGRELGVALDTRNTGDGPFELSEALHTYFQIGSIAEVAVRGLENTEYVDKVGGGERVVQEGAVIIGGEMDRVYVDTAHECIVEDRELRRRVRLVKEGSRSTVIWNPWSEKAGQMADLGADQYSRMICVEAANALDNVVVIEPGGEHRLAMTILVEPL